MRSESAEGFCYWWRGWGWLWRSRALSFYAILPFFFATTFFVSVLYLAIHYLSFWTNHFVQAVFPTHETWSGMLYYPLWATLFLLTFISLVYMAYVVHILLCGPFYSLLAERALHDLGKRDRNQFSFSLRVVLSSITKSAIFLMIGVMIVLFSFVPLINVIGVAIALMILAFDTMDYSFEAMGMRLPARLSYFFAHFPQWLGMAVSLALTLFIPGLTLLILPGAVVGAAMILKGVPSGSRVTTQKNPRKLR
jgi:CysZ protein